LADPAASKAAGALQHEKRVEAVVIMGKIQKKLLVAKSLQREAFRPFRDSLIDLYR
jgi:hypothetical protein